jgi:hypothetical protein
MLQISYMRFKTFSESKNYMHKLKILYSKHKLDRLLKQKEEEKTRLFKTSLKAELLRALNLWENHRGNIVIPWAFFFLRYFPDVR